MQNSKSARRDPRAPYASLRSPRGYKAHATHGGEAFEQWSEFTGRTTDHATPPPRTKRSGVRIDSRGWVHERKEVPGHHKIPKSHDTPRRKEPSGGVMNPNHV